MGSAQKQQNPDPQERADLFIAEYQSHYREAISAAREAAETTATHAWQNGYRQNIEAHRELVASHLKSIAAQCDQIKTHDTGEDFEKEIRDSVKALAEERIRFGAWRTRTITPYQSAAEKCDTLLNATIRAAEQTERDQPLLDRGLTDEVKKRVALWPVASWNDETGVIEIVDRATGEVTNA